MTHQEKLISAIGELDKEIFTTKDLLSTFPESNASNISASICNLVSSGLIWRVGRKKIGKSSFMFYTSDRTKANPELEQSDRTVDRGKENDSRFYKDQIADLQLENKKLLKKIAAVEKTLETVISKLSREDLISLLYSKES